MECEKGVTESWNSLEAELERGGGNKSMQGKAICILIPSMDWSSCIPTWDSYLNIIIWSVSSGQHKWNCLEFQHKILTYKPQKNNASSMMLLEVRELGTICLVFIQFVFGNSKCDAHGLPLLWGNFTRAFSWAISSGILSIAVLVGHFDTYITHIVGSSSFVQGHRLHIDLLLQLAGVIVSHLRWHCIQEISWSC